MNTVICILCISPFNCGQSQYLVVWRGRSTLCIFSSFRYKKVPVLIMGVKRGVSLLGQHFSAVPLDSLDFVLNKQRVTVLWLGSSVGQNTSLSHWRSWVRVPSKSPIKAPFTVLAEESAKYVIKLMTSKATYK